jgi:ribonucleoside-diphosphate reductase alpha chain
MGNAVFADALSRSIWEAKYRFRPAAGQAGRADESIGDSWERVAGAVASVESDAARWRREFRALLEDFRFLPAGRILAGAGTGRRVTLFNCFVMDHIEDSLEGIFEHLKRSALTMQWGGGIGIDFSTLRPRGARRIRAARLRPGRCRSCASGMRCARRCCRPARAAAR